MAMDRSEHLGLGAAVAVHGLLLGAMVIGLLTADKTLPKPEAISVSLVGEIANVSAAPDAIQEESAPPAPAQAERSEPSEPPPAPAVPTPIVPAPVVPTPVVPTPVVKVERPVEKPQVQPVRKPIVRQTPPITKTVVKKAVVKAPPVKAAAKTVAVKQPPAKTAAASARSGKGTNAAQPAGLSKNFEDRISNIGKAPGTGTAVGTPAAKSDAEIRRSVSVSLAGQIRSRVRACAPSGVDIAKIETFVTLSLDPAGRLNSVRFDKQLGVNDSNQPQAAPLRDCILQAVKAASPFEGLDKEYHDVWKNHALRLRATG
jgi:outer membrane biosynthesis protein TonB